MTIDSDIAISRDFEMKTYLSSVKAMYDHAVTQNDEIYDIAFLLTKGFSAINEAAILEDSRIIKILRYSVAPAISQMKFGQFFGLKSVGTFENDKISRAGAKHKQLKLIANKIGQFATDNLDRTRFIWLDDSCLNTKLANSYAKKWTCSIAADQNAQTAYRNWRKRQQEQSIVDHLISFGYTKSGYGGILEKDSDIKIGEYTQEIKVRGRTIQKADIAFRSKHSKRLILVEAKAVGVLVDATKRIKECCDKANDWASAPNLQSPDIVAVIAGFFTTTNIENLQLSQVRVVWEHRLRDLDDLA